VYQAYRPAIGRYAAEHRAIQLGLRSEALAQYAQQWLIAIDDISGFVAEQRQRLLIQLLPVARGVELLREINHRCITQNSARGSGSSVPW
jgi:hypothetical protein